MLKRHEVEILLKAGHPKTEVARLAVLEIGIGVELSWLAESDRAFGLDKALTERVIPPLPLSV